jgi:cell division protein FtsB
MSSHNLLRKQVTSEIKRRRLIFFTVMCLTLLYLVIRFTFGETGLFRYIDVQQKKGQLVREIKEIEARNSGLRSDVRLLKEDPFYLEKHAREEFGMAKPDEYIFKYER